MRASLPLLAFLLCASAQAGDPASIAGVAGVTGGTGGSKSPATLDAVTVTPAYSMVRRLVPSEAEMKKIAAITEGKLEGDPEDHMLVSRDDRDGSASGSREAIQKALSSSACGRKVESQVTSAFEDDEAYGLAKEIKDLYGGSVELVVENNVQTIPGYFKGGNWEKYMDSKGVVQGTPHFTPSEFYRVTVNVTYKAPPKLSELPKAGEQPSAEKISRLNAVTQLAINLSQTGSADPKAGVFEDGKQPYVNGWTNLRIGGDCRIPFKTSVVQELRKVRDRLALAYRDTFTDPFLRDDWATVQAQMREYRTSERRAKANEESRVRYEKAIAFDAYMLKNYPNHPYNKVVKRMFPHGRAEAGY